MKAYAGIALFLLACGGSDPAPRAAEPPPPPPDAKSATVAVDLGALTLQAPRSWVQSQPSSQMRAAQFTIGAEPDQAELVVYHFGSGGAGGIEANLKRWYGQFEQADGSDTAASAVTNTRTVAGLKVTTTDVSGRYVAPVRPGATEKHDSANYRMLAAIVETEAGAYYFKLLGPAATVAAAASEFDGVIGSLEPGASRSPHGGSPHTTP